MREPRLFIDQDLAAGRTIALARGQAHYLGHVMRLGAGAKVRLFNGRDGEWRGAIAKIGRNAASVALEAQARPQEPDGDLWLLFAPVKRAPIDTIATKATELGIAAFQPVFTRFTSVGRVNTGRLRANAIEAAEQCGRLTVPEIREPVALDTLLGEWPADRRLLLCDETGGGRPIADALGALRTPGGPGKWAVLTGPEGGFAPEELDLLRDLAMLTPVGLGPRLLRADTAAVAALACWQAVLGDWRADSR
ncbi:MAG: 16S rRNA (uracil(1498)-N(3))-methyltransferase [Alphaproteobacteria bacterium]